MISLICDVNVKWINSFATQMRKSTSKAAPAKQSECQCQSQSQSVSQASWPVTLGRVSLVHCAVVALIKMYRAVAMCEIVLATLIAALARHRGGALEDAPMPCRVLDKSRSNSRAWSASEMANWGERTESDNNNQGPQMKKCQIENRIRKG